MIWIAYIAIGLATGCACLLLERTLVASLRCRLRLALAVQGQLRDELRDARAQLAHVNRIARDVYGIDPEAHGVCLPGWHCMRCGCFNGSAKERRVDCRSCGAVRWVS